LTAAHDQCGGGQREQSSHDREGRRARPSERGVKTAHGPPTTGQLEAADVLDRLREGDVRYRIVLDADFD
jgi:hypothetical protein